MAPVERDAPADRQLRHLHTSSTGALIPMWDSSDPDRAPPPLPLNPQSPSVSPSKSGTSLAIQSAHAALAEKAREGENTALVPALKKRMTMGELTTPPDHRALVTRPNNHKRMQSLQPGSVRDLSLMIEGARDSRSPTPKGSPDKHSPEKYFPEKLPPSSSRPGTPSRNRERDREPEREHRSVEHRPLDKENARPTTPTPMPISLNPAVRPSMARRAQQSILGESTPPQSATMLALQNMGQPLPREAEAHPPHATAAYNSNSNANSQAKAGASWDQLSGQIISLTSIATALQKEMTQLSRRSRDNATDLMSLKEATHARDEDIRKSLRELVANIDRSNRDYRNNREHHDNRDTYPGGLYLDNKAHSTSPISRNARPFSLPRIPSPHSFAASIDRESVLSTPSLVPSESPATMALLEKIIREMGTKDGQETVINQLTELAERLAGMASSAKVEELIGYMKAVSHDQSMVPASGGRGGGGGGTTRPRHVGFDDDDDGESGPRELDWGDRNGAMTHRFDHLATQQRPSSAPSSAGDLLNEDVIKVIRSVKDSVAQGGGMTAEVKALVRELRGEVLGMGRDIARKLDDVDASATGKSETASKKEVAKIIEEGLEELKVHMNQLLREHRRASASSLKSVVDYQEIYNAMRTALNDSRVDNKSEDTDLTRDDVVDAVKDAWENYKPEIQVEQIGLERDEVLACLKEGLQEYVPRQEPSQGATKDDVFQAIVDGMKHFTPPQVESPTSLSRDEVLEAVRECLEEFEFPIAPSAMNDLTKNDVLDAVQQGLKNFDFPDNSAAVVPHQDSSEVVDRLQEIMIFMQQEFRTVSEEARQNVAASGRDTEQVLDATKDGLDQLRTHLETYIDRLAGGGGGSGQEELMSNLVSSFDSFREELSELVAHASDGSKEMIKEEIESLRDAVNSSLVPHVPPAPDNREALEALREGIERVRHELLRPHAGTTDILDALHEGFSDLRDSVEKIVNKPADFTANDEILEALQEGLSTVRTEIDALREHDNEKAVATVGGGTSDAMVPADMLKHDDIKNLEVMMTQLRIKMESLGSSHPAPESVTESGSDSTPAPPAPGGLRKEDLSEVEEMLRNVQAQVTSISNAEVEESLRNLHISVEAISNVEVQESISNLQASVEAMSNAQVLEAIRGLQESIGGLNLEKTKTKEDGELYNPEDVATKEDVQAIETILRNTKGRLEDILDGEQAVKKDHLDAVEAMVLETKDALGTVTGQLETISKKEDLVKIESLVTQVNIAFDEMKERSEKALEDPEKVTKTHVEAVEAAILGIKAAIEQSLKSDIATLSSKDDVKALENIVTELKDATTAQAEANDKALVDRRAEVAGVGDRVAEVKTFLEDLQGLMKEKLQAGATGIDHLSVLLGGMSETISQNANVGQDLKELLDVMKNEFEESKTGVIGAKLDSDEKFTQTTDVLSTKIDEKFGELIAKYDVFQTVMEERTAAGETRDAEMEAAVVGTKAIADELKVLVDTLGSSVTNSLEKMEEASKTVFSQVEQLYTKSEENHTEDKGEHQTTRDQIQQAVNIVEGLQGHVTEFQPQILETVKNVLMVVGQHYEHSRNTASQLQKQIEDTKPEEPLMLPPPPEKYDDAEVLARLEKIAELAADKYSDVEVLARLEKLAEDKYDDTEVRSKLDKLVEEKYDDKEVITRLDKLSEEKYNDAEVLAKLNQLAEDKYDDKEVLARLQKLADEKYQDTEVLARLEKLNEDLKYDDTDVLVRLEKLGEDLKYDDTDVIARLTKLDEDKYNDVEVVARLDKLVEDKYDDAGVVARLDQLIVDKYDDSQVQFKLAEIAEKCDPAEVHTKLDQMISSGGEDKAVVHTKLDKLVGHTEAAERAFEHLDTLDRVHRQVQQTAADLTHFIAAQKKRVADEQEDYGRALQETRIALERREAERSEVESSLSRLRSEEAQLRAAVASLRNEQDDMLRHKARTAADIASLETALRLRREELHAMDARAEGLERRILEGVLDHSRALLMTKQSSGKNRGDVMSRKRVPGARSSDANNNNTTTPTRSSMQKKSAVMTRLTPKQQTAANNNRRILSLSQMSHNVPSGGVSRSQSVRTPGGAGGLRKSSWTPGGGVGVRTTSKKYGDLQEEVEVEDKENEGGDHADSGHERLDEEDEREHDDDDVDDAATEVNHVVDDESVAAASDPEDGDDDVDDDDEESESGTLRRTSLGTTTTAAADDYDAASASDDYTESVGDSESISGDSEVVMVSSTS